MASTLALALILSMAMYALSVSLKLDLNGSGYMNHDPGVEKPKPEYRVPTIPSRTFLTSPVQTVERGTLIDPMDESMPNTVSYIDEDEIGYDQTEVLDDDEEDIPIIENSDEFDEESFKRNDRNLFVVAKSNVRKLFAYADGSTMHVGSIICTSEKCPNFPPCKPVEYTVRVLKKMAECEAILDFQKAILPADICCDTPIQFSFENTSANVTCYRECTDKK